MAFHQRMPRAFAGPPQQTLHATLIAGAARKDQGPLQSSF